jgi:hypothetical protein
MRQSVLGGDNLATKGAERYASVYTNTHFSAFAMKKAGQVSVQLFSWQL